MSEVNSIANLFLGNMTNQFSNSNVHTTSKQKSVDTFSQKLTEAKQTTTKSFNKTTEDKNEFKTNTTQKKEQTQSKEDTKVTKKKDNQKEITTKEEAPEKVEDLSEDELKEVVNEQILVIMSEILEIPTEEIEMQLNEMNLEPVDLLTEEGFGEWASQILAGEERNALLLNEEIDMTQIRSLFENLEGLKEDLGEEVVAQVTDLLSQLETTEEVVTMPHVANLPKEERHQEMNETVVEEDLTQLTGGEMTSNSDLGLTVPIQNFTTTTTTYQYETDSGIMTQTVTAKVTPNGQTFIEQVDFKTLGQTKELNVMLSPRELGQMNIKIVEQHGVIVAEIKVEHEKAKEFILNEIETLKQNLEEQGINVTEVKVDIRQNDRESQMHQERQKSSRRIAQILANQLTDDNELEEDFENKPILSDSKVDYIV